MPTRKASPTGPSIQELMVADAARSALDAKDLAKLKFRTITAEQCAELKMPSATIGYVIPYFELDGKETSFFRVRYLEDTRKGFQRYSERKPIKYGQPVHTVTEAYFPPLVNWKAILEKPTPIIFTEGEKKAACATKHGLPTIGLGGVWSFMSKKNSQMLLPVIEEMDLEDRVIIICFDSDAATNPDIVAAEQRFAERLVEQGAIVKIARIPVAADGAKVGMDDYILAHGVQKFKAEVLDSAFEYTASAALHALNKEVAYVRNPGVVYDITHDMKITPAQFQQHAYSNYFHTIKRALASGGEKLERVSTAKAWMEWEHRAELGTLVYEPGQPKITEQNNLNGWTGWGFGEPKKGDVSLWDAMMKHLFGTEHEARKWFEQWLAWPIQHPGAKLATAALLWGTTEGTGKSLVGVTMKGLYGRNGGEIKDAQLEDPRNEWAENKQFILADDITGHSNRKLSNRLKTMITQTELWLNPKFIPSYSVRDCINYYFTSNDPDAVFLSDGDRRWFVHEVRAEKLDRAFLKKYLAWMKSEEGKAALAFYLLSFDTADFEPGAEAYATADKAEMKHIAKSELGAWVASLKQDPITHLNGHAASFGDLITADELHAIWDPTGDKRASVNAMARELKRAGFSYPAGGTPLKTSMGFRRAYAVHNTQQWAQATYKQAIEYYEAHRDPEAKKGEPASLKPGRKTRGPTPGKADKKF